MPNGSYWIGAEEEILKSLWYNKSVTIHEIVDIMGRSAASVKAKARTMGLENREALEAMWRVEQIMRRMQEVVEA